MPPFDFNAKQVFLTFPHSTFSKQELFEYFKHHFSHLQISKILVAEESHADGSPHIHAYIYFGLRLHTRDATFFDFRNRHPNIQAARSPRAVIEYCCKGGEFISKQLVDGEWVEWTQKLKLNWGDAIDQSSSVTDFLSKIRRGDPKTYVLHYERLLEFANRHFTTPRVAFSPEFTMDSFRWTALMTTWYDQNILITPTRPKSLLLISPSRYGKTQWARSLGVHFYMAGQFNLEKFDPDATYGIFDDIPIDFLKYSYKQWLGCQKEFETSDKYKRKRTIVWGKPLIFLCNVLEYEKMKTDLDYDWIIVNCDIVFLLSPLFE